MLPTIKNSYWETEIFSTLLSKIVYKIENLANSFPAIILYFSVLIFIKINNKGDVHQCESLKPCVLVSFVLSQFH